MHIETTLTNPWYALIVTPRHEKAAARFLSTNGFETFGPTYNVERRWSDRMKSVVLPLFPGYIFCRFDYQKRLPVLLTPGVTSVVNFAGNPGIVSEEEVGQIKIICSSGLQARPWPLMAAGQSVRIGEGVLAGLTGILVREKNELRVVVSVPLLQRAVAVEVSRDVLRTTQVVSPGTAQNGRPAPLEAADSYLAMAARETRPLR